MTNVPHIDRAWDAVSLLGELSRKALNEIERLGGKGPSAQRTMSAGPATLLELKRR